MRCLLTRPKRKGGNSRAEKLGRSKCSIASAELVYMHNQELNHKEGRSAGEGWRDEGETVAIGVGRE